MAINKLSEFAKTGQKNTDGLDQAAGFPVNVKPARQWFNWLFNTLTLKINEIIDGKTDKNTTITAGNGLSGGGDLSASRTVALGVPTTITGSSGNAVSATSHTHALNVTKSDVGLNNVTNDVQAKAATQVIAGNGLSGGGDLSANRTVTLGAPGTITNSTTNTVTATSHTHAIDKASLIQAGIVRLSNTWTLDSDEVAASASVAKALQDLKANKIMQIIAGNGLSGGGTLADHRTITLGVPTTITGSSGNTVTATSHTHELNIHAADVSGLGNAATKNVGSGNQQIPFFDQNKGLAALGYGAASDSVPPGTNIKTKAWVTGWYTLSGAYTNGPVASMTGQMLVSVRQYGAGAGIIFQIWNNSNGDYYYGTCSYNEATSGQYVPNSDITWRTIYHTGNFDPSSKLDKTATAVNATKLATARNIALTGAVTGSVNFDGANNVSINTTLQQGVGVQQTWQNLTANRAFDSTYTNSTGRPIMMAVTSVGGSTGFKIQINGADAVVSSSTSTAGRPAHSITLIIPHGTTYRATGGIIESWWELR